MTGIPQPSDWASSWRSRFALYDPWLLVAAASLVTVGLMALYSYGHGVGQMTVFRRQVLYGLLGLVPFFVALRINLDWLRRAAGILYLLSLVLLVLVLAVGKSGGGAQRWIDIGFFQFQPSEFSKLATVLVLSAFYARHAPEIARFSTFAKAFAIVAPTLALIFLQPHLGATLVVLVTFLGQSIFAGVRWSSVALIVIAIGGTIGAAVQFPSLGLLRDFQVERVRAKFTHDPQGSGFQTQRALYALATGGLLGTGYLKGDLKGRFVPEQQTDFVFTIVGEEGGFVGSSLVLLAFGVVFFRGWLIMHRAMDRFSGFVAAGILSFLAFHTLVNVGMNLGLLPVVGLWLPFMSAGGTALWLCLAAVGLLLNIGAQENRLLFRSREPYLTPEP